MASRSLWHVMAAVAVAGVMAGPAAAQATKTPAPTDREALRQQEQALRDKERARRDVEQQMRDLERKMHDAQQELQKAAQQLAELQAKEHVSDVRRYVFFGKKARLGVVLQTDADAAVDALGAKVVAVSPGGPADEAGIKAGDVITTFNGEKLGGRDADEGESGPAAKLSELASGLEDGQQVKVELLRGKETKALTLKARRLDDGGLRALVETPDEDIVVPVPPIPPVAPLAPAAPRLGRFKMQWLEGGWDEMELVALNADLGTYFGTTKGLLVVRAPKDSAYKLKSGDVIVKIGDREAETPAQALRILHSYAGGETVNLEIMRAKQPVTLSVEVPKSNDDTGALWFDGSDATPRAIRIEERRRSADPT